MFQFGRCSLAYRLYLLPLFVHFLCCGALGQTASEDLQSERARHLVRSEVKAIPQQELVVGEQMSRQFDQQVRIHDDIESTHYLDVLARNLAQCAGDVPFRRIRIIEDHSANAMAFPGGYLYVNLGLLHAVRSEAELAGVLAHELGHVQLRHGSRGAKRKGWLNLISIPAMAFGGLPAVLLDELAPFGTVAIERRFERQAETKADAFALAALAACNYDPGALYDVMARLLSDKQTSAPWLATHPRKDKRLALLRSEHQTDAEPAEIVSSNAFEAMKEKLRREEPLRLIIRR